MSKEIAVYVLFFLTFIFGSIYHFSIRRQCIYPVRLTKPRIILSTISPFIFCFIAYIGGNLWSHYILALLAAVFIISGVVGEGIHKKGIYYRPMGHAALLIRLAKWEDIKDIKIDINKNKLHSFRYKTTTIYPGQYYSHEDINEFKKSIKI
ncbi:hypothetical protein GC105_06860 [Alkalibaculum sp. M08DMB]|uniref:DUF5673 domain-containing protein n=2 Tax=Alkalibaculum sporogenes TaxID=2655001 RepID=A0A6A7K7Y2_9FIRM|nr:hypothetical protein [Alkalibaculum sporogenes]